MSTPAQLDRLAQAAEAACAQAYAPYSRFYVGAAVWLQNGEIVAGCNVENASYRLTTCAEQNAIAAAVTRFGPGIRVLAVAVRSRSQAPCQPCGACRQTLAEFAAPDAAILFSGAGGRPERCTLADLLPARFHFTPELPA